MESQKYMMTVWLFYSYLVQKFVVKISYLTLTLSQFRYFIGGFKDLNPFKSWIKDELENKDVEVVEMAAMEKVAKSGKALLVVFVEEGGKPLNHQLEEAVTKICDRFDISIVKVDEREAAAKYGIDDFPTMVYFEDGIPTIFEDENDEGKFYSKT